MEQESSTEFIESTTNFVTTNKPVDPEYFDFVTRKDWNARSPYKNLTKLSKAPIKRIVLAETADRYIGRCENRVRNKFKLLLISFSRAF